MAVSPGRALSVALIGALAVACLGIAAGGSAARGGGLDLAKVGEFDTPVYAAEAPGANNLLFVVEQPGAVRVVRDGNTVNRPFLDISNRVLYGGEQGLLSIAFHP